MLFSHLFLSFSRCFKLWLHTFSSSNQPRLDHWNLICFCIWGGKGHTFSRDDHFMPHCVFISNRCLSLLHVTFSWSWSMLVLFLRAFDCVQIFRFWFLDVELQILMSEWFWCFWPLQFDLFFLNLWLFRSRLINLKLHSNILLKELFSR